MIRRAIDGSSDRAARSGDAGAPEARELPRAGLAMAVPSGFALRVAFEAAPQVFPDSAVGHASEILTARARVQMNRWRQAAEPRQSRCCWSPPLRSSLVASRQSLEGNYALESRHAARWEAPKFRRGVE